MDINKLKEMLFECNLSGEKIIIKSNLFETIKFVKENYDFDMLKEIIAIDNNDGTIELMYRLHSIDNNEDTIISITVKDTAESISKLYDSAIADEKEIYDLFGIKFIGNDELERLYMPESWKGHPLRKDYGEKDERLSWNERN